MTAEPGLTLTIYTAPEEGLCLLASWASTQETARRTPSESYRSSSHKRPFVRTLAAYRSQALVVQVKNVALPVALEPRRSGGIEARERCR
ncbi:MAG: hypothetical protein JWL99_4469, partial [Streptomyces oryziradicis]|nr:hypothetical protein [Actinacidiphila oryziradicis]